VCNAYFTDSVLLGRTSQNKESVFNPVLYTSLCNAYFTDSVLLGRTSQNKESVFNPVLYTQFKTFYT